MKLREILVQAIAEKLVGTTWGPHRERIARIGGVSSYNRQARGRIRDEKFRIDAYLWFDGPTPTHIFLTVRDHRHESKLRRYLEPVCRDIAG